MRNTLLQLRKEHGTHEIDQIIAEVDKELGIDPKESEPDSKDIEIQ